MEDEQETTEIQEQAEVPPQGTPVEGTEVQEPEGGDNPAWGPIRDSLDDVSYQAIKPKLKDFDSEAQRRIESVNSKFKWASDLQEQGVTPEQVQQSITVAQRINDNPEEIYQALGQFLQENGRLPKNDQELEEATDNNSDEGGSEDNSRIDQLQQQQEAFQNYMESQEQEKLQQQAQADIDQEIEQLKKNYPDFDNQDIQEVLLRAYNSSSIAAQNGKDEVKPLSDYAQDYKENVRDRIMKAQESRSKAPDVIPTGGGFSTGGEDSKSLGQRSNDEIQDLVSNFLKKS